MFQPRPRIVRTSAWSMKQCVDEVKIVDSHSYNEQKLRKFLFAILYRNLYSILMKTTLNIQDQLLANAKSAAALQQTTLTRLIEEGLVMRLALPAKKASARKVVLPVMNGKGGMRLGIDPTSNRAILNAMDE
jgi:hypothetical protein